MPANLMGIENELLLEFFLTFSRFEFALKNAGFYKKFEGVEYSAEPDWESFALRIKQPFREQNDALFMAACHRIWDTPPRKQVVRNDSLDWRYELIPSSDLDIKQILVYVRRIRNNLFHGGKHESVSYAGEQRNKCLLKDSLIVLHGCLGLLEDVKCEYDRAVF